MIAFLIRRDSVTGLLNESTLMLIIILCETTESVYSQRERVEQNEHKHNVLKLRGIDDLPKFELRRVFGYVNLYWLSFQCVIHTLSL